MRGGKLAIVSVTVVSATGLGAVPAANASDAGLRKVVKRWEMRVTPLAVAFQEADAALTQGGDTNAASAANGAFRAGLRKYKLAVVPIKTQSVKAKAGKKQILTAIREFDLGLVEYQKLIDKINSGAPKDSVLSSFKTLNKRLTEAAKDEAAALKLLGIKLKSS